MIRLFQINILQYSPDMSVIRLDRDAAATSLDDTIHSPIFSKSASSPLPCFLISLFLVIILIFLDNVHMRIVMSRNTTKTHEMKET